MIVAPRMGFLKTLNFAVCADVGSIRALATLCPYWD
jgi:hypothetical protein